MLPKLSISLLTLVTFFLVKPADSRLTHAAKKTMAASRQSRSLFDGQYLPATKALVTGSDVCLVDNSVACQVASNGTDCSRLMVLPSICYVPVVYTFTTCNMAAQTNVTIIRFTAKVLHVDVSGSIFDGLVLRGGACQTLKVSHDLNTCDLRTDFGSLYVKAKSVSSRCEDYLFHWANGIESKSNKPTSSPTKKIPSKPSVKPSKKPSLRPSKRPILRPSGKPSLRPRSAPTVLPSRRPSAKVTNKPFLRHTSSPSKRPTRLSAHPTLPSLPVGQYYVAADRLVAGPDVCVIDTLISCKLASNGTDCSRLLVLPSICYVPVIYTFTTCNMASQTNVTVIRSTAKVLHADVSGSIFDGLVLRAGVCQTYQYGHNLNTCDIMTDFGSLYVRSKTTSGNRCEDYLFHWANGLETKTNQPTSSPSKKPSKKPTARPTSLPSVKPSTRPSAKPSGRPSTFPSSRPSVRPSMTPSTRPSAKPSGHPSKYPSNRPSVRPSYLPSMVPSSRPSVKKPSGRPSKLPSSKPSSRPSVLPSPKPSMRPSVKPTKRPTVRPSLRAKKPSGRPSSAPRKSKKVSLLI